MVVVVSYELNHQNSFHKGTSYYFSLLAVLMLQAALLTIVPFWIEKYCAEIPNHANMPPGQVQFTNTLHFPMAIARPQQYVVPLQSAGLQQFPLQYSTGPPQQYVATPQPVGPQQSPQHSTATVQEKI